MQPPPGPTRTIPLPPSPLLRAGAMKPPPRRDAPNRRRFHRVVVVNGPCVRMEVRRPDGTRLHGIVEDCAWAGAAVRFGYNDDPHIRVDQVGVVIVTSLRMPDITLRARVASAEPLGNGGTRYGLQFLDHDELHRQVTPEWRRWFSRRRAPRFEPREELAATLTVGWRGGEARGRVLDASIAGLGVELDLESARQAVVAREVGVLLAFPGSGGTIRLRAAVRGAKHNSARVRVGLEFLDDAGFAQARTRIEAWAERLKAKSLTRSPRGPGIDFGG